MAQPHHFIHLKNYRLLYGRVPKAANSSIKAALSWLLSERPPKGTKTTSDKFWQHATQSETELITLRRARRLRLTHFSFSFVRNPFDRLVAAYNNKVIQIEDPPLPMKNMGIKHGISFSNFLDILTDTPLNRFDVHVIPQHHLLCLGKTIVPKFVGRVEQIDDHWSELRSILKRRDINLMEKLPQKNVRRSEKSSLQNYFCKDIITEKAIRLYQADLDLFYSDASVDQLISNQPLPESPPILSNSLRFKNWLKSHGF